MPVLTIYPATAAMFAVFRGWVRAGDHAGVLSPFLSAFRENFMQSLGLGVAWTLFGAWLALDLALAGRMQSELRFVLYAFFSAAGILYVFASLYLFPVLVSYDAGWLTIARNSFLLSVSRPLTTVCCLLVVGAAILVFVLAPISVLVTGSPTAYAVYRLCDRVIQTVASKDGRGP